jgi:hypothetical protein
VTSRDRTVDVDASEFRSFGESDGASFYLVTAPRLEGRFNVQPGSKYVDAHVVAYDGSEDFGSFIARLPEPAHILAIVPSVYLRSPSPEQLGSRRKLAVMASNSTPTPFEAIEHFLRMGALTDPAEQEQLAESFFERGERAECLRFVDEEYGTVAEFDHLREDFQWHEQCGYLDWGQQQLFPSGEISVLPVSVFGQDIEEVFALDGQIALRGTPVLHSGTPSFLPQDQERLFQALSTMERAAVIATVEDGRVVDVVATAPDAAPAARALTSLGMVDSRYRCVLELGFGVNTQVSFYAGNSAMNEVYGGTAGAVHFGFGLIPYTQYHLDVVSPGTTVLDTRGDVVFGAGSADGARERTGAAR